MTTEQLQDIQGAIVSCFVAQVYLVRVKAYNMPVFRQKLKRLVNDTIKELTIVEKDYFDKIEDANEYNTIATSENQLKLIELLIKDNSYIDFVMLQQVMLAYGIKPKNIEGLAQKIIKENNEKQKKWN